MAAQEEEPINLFFKIDQLRSKTINKQLYF